MQNKEDIMSRCVELALGAKGHTKTNPLVGACILKDGRQYFGIHEEYGKAHAEVNAVNNAKDNAYGSEIFVTLEPCSTYGKTPPCVDLIISKGIKKVYIGVLDPNPSHAGRGVNILKKAGIDVEYGILSEKCGILIEDFIKYQKYKKPYVTLKTAVSVDGRIATRTGDSKWITCDESLKAVHKMRGETDCILTGIGTVMADDPLLTDRRDEAVSQPLRAVLDSSCKISLSSKLVKSATESKVVVFTGKNADSRKIADLENAGVEVCLTETDDNGYILLEDVLDKLYSMGIMNVMVESGSRLNGSFFDNNLVDKIEIFMAPKIIGGEKAVSSIGGKGADYLRNVSSFKSWDIMPSGKDIRITARIKDYVTEIVDFTKKFVAE